MIFATKKAKMARNVLNKKVFAIDTFITSIIAVVVPCIKIFISKETKINTCNSALVLELLETEM